MAHVGVAIAEAVKADLNAESFSQSFTATREYLPRYGPGDLQTLRVVVVPAGWSSDLADRGRVRIRDWGVDVAVVKKLDPSDNAAVDPLMALLDEIVDRYEQQESLATYTAGTARLVKAEAYPAAPAGYVPEEMEAGRLFWGLVKLTFRTID